MAPELVEQISRTLIAASRAAGSKDRIESSGVDAVLAPPAEFAAMLRREREQIAAVAKQIGFKKES